MIAFVRGVITASIAAGPSVVVQVGEHRCGVGLEDGGRRGNERVGGHDHLVPGADARGQ